MGREARRRAERQIARMRRFVKKTRAATNAVGSTFIANRIAAVTTVAVVPVADATSASPTGIGELRRGTSGVIDVSSDALKICLRRARMGIKESPAAPIDWSESLASFEATSRT